MRGPEWWACEVLRLGGDPNAWDAEEELVTLETGEVCAPVRQLPMDAVARAAELCELERSAPRALGYRAVLFVPLTAVPSWVQGPGRS